MTKETRILNLINDAAKEFTTNEMNKETRNMNLEEEVNQYGGYFWLKGDDIDKMLGESMNAQISRKVLHKLEQKKYIKINKCHFNVAIVILRDGFDAIGHWTLN